MNKGYILSLSLICLLITSVVLSIIVDQVKSLQIITSQLSMLYERLDGERWILDEAIFYASFEEDDEITEMWEDYTYIISINDDKVEIKVEGEVEYTIIIKYDTNCSCFVDIKYK